MGGRLVIHTAFGTAVWNVHSIHESFQTEFGLKESDDSSGFPKHLDFITAREETYPHPAALPVIEPGSIESDLRRRDFTINTLAIKLTKDHFGELVDLFDGSKDIQNGWIRVIHDNSFLDDPTRQLRAVRFEQRFGFQIEDHTLKLMLEAKSYLRIITGIRVRHELDLLFKEERFDKMFARAQELGILAAIQPTLFWKPDIAQALSQISQVNWDSEWGVRPSFGRIGFWIGLGYILWLSHLPIPEESAIVQQLSVPQVIANACRKAHQLGKNLPEFKGMTTSQITFRLDRYSPIVILTCLSLANDKWLQNTLEEYLTHWRKIAALSTGHDLRKLGLPAGPVYKSILQKLRAAWLDGQVHSRDEEQVLLKELLKQ